MNRLESYTKDIIKLCEAHRVKSLYAFGSVLTDNFNKESDIDLIVDFSNIEVEDYADNYFDFKFSLSKIPKACSSSTISICGFSIIRFLTNLFKNTLLVHVYTY
jgi:predicted nucleotidyltransferase